MAHKTLIGGTAYEISGGKTLVNGTAYSIDKGKTLVGGTAYEVGFGLPFTVILDFGALTTQGTVTTNGDHAGGYVVSSVSTPVLSTGWDACTHVAVDGVIYEVKCTNNAVSATATKTTYTPVGDCPLNLIVALSMGGTMFTVSFKKAGTYNLQLGVLS